MPWAQRVEAFQKQWEAGNSLSSGPTNLPLNGEVSFLVSILGTPAFSNRFRYQLSSVFKEQCSDRIKLLDSSPTGS